MQNPTDPAIADLIEKLAGRASSITLSAEERQTCIDQIAQLRASMEPTVIIQEKN